MTHSLSNNRADKLRGARRSQARVCGPDVPSGGPRVGLRAPHARPRTANSRPASSSHSGRPARDSRNNEAGSAAPRPRAPPSPERRAGRVPLPGPGPRSSRLRPAARPQLGRGPRGSVPVTKGPEFRTSRPAARGYLPPGLRIQPPRLKFTLAGSAGSGVPLPTRRRRLGRLGPARALESARLGRLSGLAARGSPGGLAVPPIELVGLLRRTFFFFFFR